jgi:hypothetical protein
VGLRVGLRAELRAELRAKHVKQLVVKLKSEVELRLACLHSGLLVFFVRVEDCVAAGPQAKTFSLFSLLC